jgi:hypothetical protein
MQMFVTIASNLATSLWAGLCVAAYFGATIALGRRIAPAVQSPWAGMNTAIAFSTGAAAIGLAITLLAWAGLAYAPLVVALAYAPFVGALVPRLPAALRRMRRASNPPPAHTDRLSPAGRMAGWCIALLALHPIGLALTSVRGGDIAIYHLVVARSVVWNHALVFNPFSHDAGIYYGWQLFSLPPYILAGDRGYLLCSVGAFALLLQAVHRVVRDRVDRSAGRVAALVVALAICGMSRESAVNNDVPLVLLEFSLVALALVGPITLRTAAIVGGLSGFVVAVKLIAVVTPLLAGAALLWRARRQWVRIGGAMTLAGAAALAPWPLFGYFASGSPLPHFLLAWPPTSGYLPQYRETITFMMEHFGLWYRANAGRFFTHGMEFVPLLLAGLAMIPSTRTARADRLCLALVGYGVGRMLLLMAINRFDLVVLFHDRYHLASWLALCVAGACAWMHVVRSSPRWQASRLLRYGAPIGILVAVLGMLMQRPVSADVQEKGVAPTLRKDRALWTVVRDNLRESFQARPGGGPDEAGFDFSARHLPADAVVATTAIDPYLLGRPFLQMLPVSENLVDLSLPPEALLRALRAHGATHLHLTEVSGLNGWMMPLVERWTAGLRGIPALPGVRRLIQFDTRISHGTQAYYALAPVASTTSFAPPKDLRVEAWRRGGYWKLHWSAAPGGDVRVERQTGPDTWESLGVAASDIGEFPLAVALPAGSLLRVSVTSPGVAPMVTELPIPQRTK